LTSSLKIVSGDRRTQTEIVQEIVRTNKKSSCLHQCLHLLC